jgi:transcriptional regulator with XRE-family HTH domain
MDRYGVVKMRQWLDYQDSQDGDRGEGALVMEREGHGRHLGRWVAQRRNNLGMSQELVWKRMGLQHGSMNWVTKLETGKIGKLPDQEYLEALSEALKVPVTEVLRGAGVLPEGVDQAPEIAPGSTTMHALIDMIDWTRDQTSREDVEGLLRLILDRQKRR